MSFVAGRPLDLSSQLTLLAGYDGPLAAKYKINTKLEFFHASDGVFVFLLGIQKRYFNELYEHYRLIVYYLEIFSLRKALLRVQF